MVSRHDSRLARETLARQILAGLPARTARHGGLASGGLARNLVQPLVAVQEGAAGQEGVAGQMGVAGQAGVLQLGRIELGGVELGEVNQALPDGGFLQGGVVELSVSGGAALATTLSLAACRSAQRRAQAQSGEPAWCAFIDPSGSLYGPGVLESGVSLERLLVVRPPVEALGQVALRVAESRAFSVLVIDTLGVPGSFGDPWELGVSLKKWSRIVRRLSLSVQNSNAVILLLTDKKAARSLPLPVAQRIELERPQRDKFSIWVKKDRFGRVFGKRIVHLARPATTIQQHSIQGRSRETSEEESAHVRRFA